MINDDANFPIRYFKVKSTKWTFQADKTRKWVQSWCRGRVLNAFAGETKVRHAGEVVRNDANPDRPADYHRDVNNLGEVLEPSSFDTIIHDPPWSNRQAMVSYEGFQAGEVGETMRLYNRLLRPGGRVIGLGFTTTLMPKKYGYDRLELAIFCPIGRGDDYLGAVDEKTNRVLTEWSND